MRAAGPVGLAVQESGRLASGAAIAFANPTTVAVER